MNRVALTIALFAVACGWLLVVASIGNGAPAEVHTGGTMLDARRITFQALAGLERRGYTVDRSLLRVRVIWDEHECYGFSACATMNRYTGERVVWWSQDLVQEAVVIDGRRRTPTCLAFNIATHELLHHASTLRVVYRYRSDGYLATSRDGYTTDEYDLEHEAIERVAAVYAAQAEHNGRCIAIWQAGSEAHGWPDWRAAERLLLGGQA